MAQVPRRAPHLLVVALLLAAGAAVPLAQVEFTNNFKYNSGQSVQPVFEGWSWAADGSINMHFGYLNRNYVEQPHVPVGANNSIEPGGPDRGQPTLFYTRTRRNLFTVNVPRTWGARQELVWTVTVNGKTEKAFGWRQTEWEIDPAGGAGTGGNTDEDLKGNKPPVLVIEPLGSLKLPAAATLVTSVSDDGIPRPRGRGRPAVGQETPPTLRGGPETPVNLPINVRREAPAGAAARGAAGGSTPAPTGPAVTWMVWRGPADATFSPATSRPTNGKTSTTATFRVPGQYVLRASASDTAMSTDGYVSVRVD